MSSQHPGGPRRRRIAGERRGKTTPFDEQSPVEPQSKGFPATAPPEPESKGLPATAPAETDKGPDQPPAKPVTTSKTKPVAKPVGKPVAKPVATPAPEPVGDVHDGHDQDGVPDSRPAGWWGSKASLVLLSALLAALLLLAGLAALGVLGTDGVADVNEAEAVERATDTAPSAAETAAAAVLAYDHTSLEADLDTAVKFMTDDFAEEYSETFEKVVAPTAEDSQAKVTAAVRAAGVIRATEDTARVLLFVDQATVTAESERPRIALNRVVMTMVREGDRWLVDDISPY